jgi:hypothetical protein
MNMRLKMRQGLLFLFSALIVALPTSLVVAKNEGLLSKLLAPGPLMEGHAEFEGNQCLKCHDAGKGVPDGKCVECHKEIRPFIEEKRGYHGLVTKTCRECHSDHKGRDYNSVAVDQNNFDHKKLTGYSLDGKHSKLKCEECHTETRKNKPIPSKAIRYFGKQATCVSCHKKDDVHFFKGSWAKKDCAACHSPESWKENTHLDHLKETKYPLKGKHDEIKCSECHIVKGTKNESIYKWPKLKTEQCLICHETPHKGRFSARFQNGKCDACHGFSEWKLPKFDHSVTRYPLHGKHAQIKCEDCHKQDPKIVAQPNRKNWKWQGLKSECLSCHKDYHKFGPHQMKRFSPLNSCTPCHTDTKWKDIKNFDHNVHTRFVVDGKHEEVKCEECHLTKDAKAKPIVWLPVGVYKWQQLEQKTCENCHKNPHIGKFSEKLLAKKCTACHITTSWSAMKDGKDFDHSKTRFALTGKHRNAACADCHKRDNKEIYKFGHFEQKFCIECHTNIHDKMFSAKFNTGACADCHTTDNFTKRQTFDHGTTRMPLNGAHGKLECASCHTPSGTKMTIVWPNLNKKEFPQGKKFEHNKYYNPNYKPGECLSCHADVHKGQLGSDCKRCHTETAWKIKNFDHNKQTHYELQYKHADVACNKCHTPIKGETVKEFKRNVQVVRYKPISAECSTCHKDVHKGNFGPNCKECHTERGWKVTRDFHKNFTLTGIHYSLDCAECHKDGRKLAGLSQQCLACHQKDDVHYGTLPHCQDCHRQQFWDINSYKHSLSLFPLRGTHRTLDCSDCHKTGVYQGLSTSCYACHSADYAGATSPNHVTGNFSTTCTNCHHQQFTW